MLTITPEDEYNDRIVREVANGVDRRKDHVCSKRETESGRRQSVVLKIDRGASNSELEAREKSYVNRTESK